MIQGVYKKPYDNIMMALYVMAVIPPFLALSGVMVTLEMILNADIDLPNKHLISLIGASSTAILVASVYLLPTYPGVSVALACWSAILSVIAMNGVIQERDIRIQEIANAIKGG